MAIFTKDQEGAFTQSNPDGLTEEQIQSGYSTIPGPYDALTGQLKSVPGLPTLQTSNDDPLTRFNTLVFDLFQKAKEGQFRQKSGLEELQIANSMAPASQLGLEGLIPSDAIAARQRQADQYEPAISNINDRVKMFNDTLSYAKELGETYFKNIQPSEQTIEAARMQLRAGFVPSEDVLEKISRSKTPFTEDDWMAAAAAKKKGTGEDELLSVSEAQALGVPYGTTKSQAMGQSVTGKPTAEQSKARQFAVAAENANNILNSSTYKLGNIELGFMPNVFKSSDRQVFEQGARAFVNAVLRRESGATITDSEFLNKYKELIPQAGDRDEVIAQKALARNAAVQSIQEAGNPATIYNQSGDTSGGNDDDILSQYGL